MRYLLSSLLILLSLNLTGQITGTVSDKETGKPVEYANIFLKDLKSGTTSALNGSFSINLPDRQRTLIVSAIGYETQEVNAETNNITIELVPRNYELPEIKVKPKKHKSALVINPFKKIKSKSFVSTGEYPWIVTRYFSYLPEYKSTPFIKQIRLFTVCHVDSAIFNLRLLSIGENGQPSVDLLNKNLIITVKKEKSEITVNLSDYRLSFPEKGFFVAVEWLIISQNINYTKNDNRIHIDPMFGLIPEEKEVEVWTYSAGKWHKSKLYTDPGLTKSGQIAVELTITD